MKALLVRVGADSTPDGGAWNAPVDSENRRFAYVPIPEARQVRTGGGRPYSVFEEAVSAVGASLTPGAQYCTGIGQRRVHHLSGR